MPFDPNDDETKKAIAEAVATAVAEEKAGLKRKNDELLAELKEARRGKAIDPADLEKLEARAEDLAVRLATAEKQVKEAARAKEAAEKALTEESSFTHKLLVENGLVAALTANGVTDAAYIEAAKAMHFGSVKIVADGAERKALYGDKPLPDAIKEWAASDVGKKFVAAPNNGGGGANGGQGKSGGKTMARSAFDALSPIEQGRFIRDGGQAVDIAA